VLRILEATFEDDKQEDAKRKKHSTTGEALGVAAKVTSSTLLRMIVL
jgi:ribonuclease BN (tRNA processing enzyme)